jgi:hypothetical protein
MKTLTFSDDQTSKDRFQFIYQGFLLGAPNGGLKGIEANRRAFKIMDKLEAISEPVTGKVSEGAEPEALFYPTGDAIRALKPEGGVLLLEEAEIKMLREHLNETPWRPSLSKGVVDADDFLASSPAEITKAS